MALTRTEILVGAFITGSIFFMVLVGLFSITDAGQTLTHVAGTGDFAGYSVHGVEEDHWSVIAGLYLHNL